MTGKMKSERGRKETAAYNHSSNNKFLFHTTARLSHIRSSSIDASLRLKENFNERANLRLLFKRCCGCREEEEEHEKIFLNKRLTREN
jgi:hypothetical protein